MIFNNFILGVLSIITTIRIKSSTYMIIIVSVLPINSLINPIVNLFYDFKIILQRNVEKKQLKR